jgi:hypothetical protein
MQALRQSEKFVNTSSLIKNFALILMISGLFLAPAANGLRADEKPNLFQNLVPIEGAQAALAEVDPNADFSAFSRVKILDVYVAFRSNWARDQQRTGTRTRISESDIERIKGRVEEQFLAVFTEVLEDDEGYEVVAETGEDVLLIRPAIIDLDITAPDTRNPGRTTTFTTETGAATLYIELYDSVSGQILGRAADRQVIRSAGNTLSWSSRASNTADARRMFRSWASALREFLDEHYMD